MDEERGGRMQRETKFWNESGCREERKGEEGRARNESGCREERKGEEGRGRNESTEKGRKQKYGGGEQLKSHKQ